MPLTIEQLETASLALEPQERERLAHLLLDSLHMRFSDPTDVERAWLAEIERRRQRFASGESNGVPADEALARVRTRVRSA